MFEDIYKVKPNVKEELKEIIQDQIDQAIAHSMEKGEDPRIIDRFSVLLDDELDTVTELYLTNFNTEELVAVIDWTNSDLGKKAVKFSMDNINPIVLGIFNKVLKEMFDGMFDDEDIPEGHLKDEWETDLPDLKDFDLYNKKDPKCQLPAGPWDKSCTLEEDCLCGCEGGDPDEDSEILFFGEEIPEKEVT